MHLLPTIPSQLVIKMDRCIYVGLTLNFIRVSPNCCACKPYYKKSASSVSQSTGLSLLTVCHLAVAGIS
jgi:hypothetical protein